MALCGWLPGQTIAGHPSLSPPSNRCPISSLARRAGVEPKGTKSNKKGAKKVDTTIFCVLKGIIKSFYLQCQTGGNWVVTGQLSAIPGVLAVQYMTLDFGLERPFYPM
jgi:hypothetical protein